MTSTQSTPTSSEAVAVFEDAQRLQAAIDELQSSGFDRAELSLLASERAVQEKLSHAYKKVEELEDDASVPRAAYVSVESVGDAEGGLIGGLMYVGAAVATGVVVASGGTLAAAIAAAVAAGGAGTLIGSVLAKLVGDQHAHRIQEQLDHGGLLLWVRTRDKEHEKKATEILSKFSAHDVHIHSLPVHGQ
jgi:hypothetical protein